MTNGQIGGLIGFSFLLAAGQTLFKMTALAAMRHAEGGFFLTSLLMVPSFWAALVLYGGATLLWIYLLQSVPLSRAYPFAALGFLIVPVLAMLLFGEKLTFTYIIGAVLIVAGLLVTVRA